MPTYQYACTSAACGKEFELVQSFTDPAASECPSCHGPVRKVFSAVGVVFKGSGFYRTDSRAGNGTVPGGKSKHEHDHSGGSGGSDSTKSSESSKSSSGTSSSSTSSDSGSSGSGANSSSTSTKSSAPTPAA